MACGSAARVMRERERCCCSDLCEHVALRLAPSNGPSAPDDAHTGLSPRTPWPSFDPISRLMSWWSRLVGGKSESELKPQRLDYLSEALALERQGDYDAALTSYRLALRDQPDDPKVLQNMAIAFSKTGRLDEAVRCYR